MSNADFQPTDPLLNLKRPDDRLNSSTLESTSSSTPAFNNDNISNGSTTSSANVNSNLQSAKDTIVSSASQAMNTISNHPATQQAKDAVVNGPVGQAVQEQSAKTSSEFQDLANSRKVPDQPAATGQPLTHYHSLFYRLLSWKNPRATGISFAAIVILIFTTRYFNILRYTFKGLYTILGITALAELAGKVALGNGFATQLRPRKYYTIRKESLERFLDDVEQLINFVVIEFQRIVFVENIWVTAAAFTSSFLSYWLIKWLPLWGLTLIATSVTFLGPLVYLSNQEFIDSQLNHAGNVISSQATQVRDLAAQHTNQAAESLKTVASDYSQKAQGFVASTREKVNGSTSATTSTVTSKSSAGYTANKSTTATTGSTGVKTTDFPTAPHNDPLTNGRTSEALYTN